MLRAKAVTPTHPHRIRTCNKLQMSPSSRIDFGYPTCFVFLLIISVKRGCEAVKRGCEAVQRKWKASCLHPQTAASIAAIPLSHPLSICTCLSLWSSTLYGAYKYLAVSPDFNFLLPLLLPIAILPSNFSFVAITQKIKENHHPIKIILPHCPTCLAETSPTRVLAPTARCVPFLLLFLLMCLPIFQC